MPVRPKNADVRTREYLTDDEVQRLAEAAKANRHGHRDATMKRVQVKGLPGVPQGIYAT